MRERGEPTETRGMAEQGQRARDPVDVSTRTFLIAFVVVLLLLATLAAYLRYGT